MWGFRDPSTCHLRLCHFGVLHFRCVDEGERKREAEQERGEREREKEKGWWERETERK